MVVAETTTKAPWDAFLQDENRLRVEGFRRAEWPEIRRELQQLYGITVRDEDEPHWVEPGAAVFYMQESIRRQGETIESKTWTPVSPDRGIPAHSSHEIAQWISPQKRTPPMRLRPPVEGETEEPVAISTDIIGLVEPPAPTVSYTCSRHGTAGRFLFNKWDSYVAHCVRHAEMPEHDPPKEVKALIEKVPYYCFPCGKPFSNDQLADRHRRTMLRLPGSHLLHPSLEAMKVKPPEPPAAPAEPSRRSKKGH